MNTVTVFILLVALSGVISAPADDKQTAATRRLGKIRSLRQTMLQIVNEMEESAIEENAEIGHSIEATVDNEIQRIRDQIKMSRTHPSINTPDGTKQIFDDMLGYFDAVRNSINGDLQKLKPETQEAIKLIYKNGVVKTKALMEEIQGMPIQ